MTQYQDDHQKQAALLNTRVNIRSRVQYNEYISKTFNYQIVYIHNGGSGKHKQKSHLQKLHE
ncbi:hypothetical protein SMBr_03450 [Shewanella sp. M-Br]|nr:hypothetical protein SMBr_03450 [Shewanella sp. M-Br]